MKNLMYKKDKNKIHKPNWIKIKLPVNFTNVKYVDNLIEKNGLHTVCKEASCPNLPICFSRGTATFMILGSICTRNCPFCDVEHGKPSKLDTNEPNRIAEAVQKMNLNHVVITSVNRDDLPDGGAKQFLNCIYEIRSTTPNVCIEILVPDFKRKMDIALEIINSNPPDIFNHNIENVPRLYKKIRPGANYDNSLMLLKKFKDFNPNIITKSGLILGLGEKKKEILKVMKDLRKTGVTMLTLGQYLRPSKDHIPVVKYIDPKFFHFMKEKAIEMGFIYVASGPMVRSSYYADIQKEKNKESYFL